MTKHFSVRKWILVLLLILALAALAAVGWVCLHMHHPDTKGSMGQAQVVLSQLLSCSIAEDTAGVSADKEDAASTGLTTVYDSGIGSWMKAQLDDLVTEECMDTLMLNRVPARISALVSLYDSSIETTMIQMTASVDEENSFDYTADLQTITDHTVVGAACGTITMVKEDGVWKASSITLQLETQSAIIK